MSESDVKQSPHRQPRHDTYQAADDSEYEESPRIKERAAPTIERTLSPTEARAKAQQSDPSSSATAEAHAYATLWRVVYTASLSWDVRIRRAHACLSVLGVLSFGVVLAMFQSCWDARTLNFELDPAYCAAYAPLRIVGLGLWVAFVANLTWYYYLKSGLKALLSVYPTRRAAFFNSGLLRTYVVEVFLSLLQPFPLLHLLIDLHHAQYLVILSFLSKIYLLVRLLRDYSAVYQQRMFLKRGTRFDASYYAMDLLTVFKTYIYRYTLHFVVVGALLNAFIMAYLLHICERELWMPQNAHAGPLPRRFDDMTQPAHIEGGGGGDGEGSGSGSFVGRGSELLLTDGEGVTYFQNPYVSLLNCIYFVGIVATTTGLGDVAPVTEQGKIFAVMTAVMGVVWAGFGVGLMTNKLVPTDFQSYCIDYLARSEVEAQKQNLAATLIQKCWRLHRQINRTLQGRYRQMSARARAAKFDRELGHAIMKFQHVMRREDRAHFVYVPREHEVGATASRHEKGTVESASSKGSSPTREGQQRGSGSGGGGGRIGNDSVRRLSYQGSGGEGEGAAQQLSPLMRSSSRPSDIVRHRRGSATPISAEHALRALTNLNRSDNIAASGGGTSSTQASPRHLTISRGNTPPGFRGGSGSFSSSSNTATIAALVHQHDALAATLRAMDSKLDQLLSASARQGMSENMLEHGHTFVGWTAQGEDAVASKVLLWLERDDTKYGSLHWTTEEFAVQSRLRLKVPGQSFPLHSITDVHLGKTSSEFNMPSAQGVPAALCFTVQSKAYPPGLKLQAQHPEERTHWISQLKQAFLPKRTPGSTGSGSSTPGGPPGHRGSVSISTTGLQAAGMAGNEAAAAPGTGGGRRGSTARRPSDAGAHQRAASYLPPSNSLAALATASSSASLSTAAHTPPPRSPRTPGSERSQG